VIAALLVFVDRHARAEHDELHSYATGRRTNGKAAARRKRDHMREVRDLVDECIAADLAGVLDDENPLVEQLIGVANSEFADRPDFQDRWAR